MTTGLGSLGKEVKKAWQMVLQSEFMLIAQTEVDWDNKKIYSLFK